MKKNKWYMLISLFAVISMVMVSCGSGADTAQAEAPAAEDAAVEEPAAEEPAAADAAAEPVTIDVWFHSGKGEEREVLDAQVTAFQ